MTNEERYRIVLEKIVATREEKAGGGALVDRPALSALQAQEIASTALAGAKEQASATDAPTHRHKKRGSEYVLVGYGKMQAASWRDKQQEEDIVHFVPVDMREVAIYRSVEDGSLWVRPREEFEDGRFEVISPTEPGVEGDAKPVAWQIGEDGALYATKEAADKHIAGWAKKGVKVDSPRPLYTHPSLLEECREVDLPWNDMKVAFDILGDATLWNAHDRGELKLPDGWELNETDGSGARMVAVFRVNTMPSIADGKVVANLLTKLEAGR